MKILRLWIFVLCALSALAEVKIVKKVTPKDDFEAEDDSGPLLHEITIKGPVIGTHPQNMEVVAGRTNSSTLRCSATHALSVHLICSPADPNSTVSEYVKDHARVVPSKLTDIVDPMSGVRHIELEADMEQTVFSKLVPGNSSLPTSLYCVCHAWSSQGNSTSRIATVKLVQGKAVEHRKHVKDSPKYRLVNLGEKVELDCSLALPQSSRVKPRDGYGEREVSWLLDGQPFLLDDNLGEEGSSLLILRAKIKNEGTYSCAIGERIGEPITVGVKANGNWSPWGAWSDCFTRCGKGSRSRTRSCTNPAPRNNGRECQGDYIQKEECTSWRDCTSKEKDNEESGVWTTWTSWSGCDSNCKQHRQRRCAPPKKTSRSGTPVCVGRSHISRNCTGGECPPGSSDLSPGGSKGLQDGQGNALSNNFLQDQDAAGSQEQGFFVSHIGGLEAIAMVVGMALAAIILAFTFLIALRFRPRESSCHGDKPHHVYPAVPISGLSTLPPDVAPGYGDPRLHEYLTERKLDSGVTIPLLQQLYPPTVCALPMTPSQSRSNYNSHRSRTPSSTEKTRTDSESQHYSDYGGAPTSEYDMIYDTIPDELKTPPDGLDEVSWGTFGPEGGRVSLHQLGVSLLVPPGAIRHGRRELYVAVLKEDRDRPSWLREEQSLLSAVLQCGPCDVALARPLVLSFDHCAAQPADKWRLHVLSAEGDNDEARPLRWKEEATALSSCSSASSLSSSSPGQEIAPSKSVFCQLDNGRCHLQTRKMARFVLVGESRAKSYAAKSVALIAFLSKISSLSQNEHAVRVYCVEETKAALQNVFSCEEGRSVLLEEAKSILLHDGGANLCLTLESSSLSPHWKFKPGANQQEIPFKHVWSSRLSSLHCSFVLTSTAPEAHLQCRVVVYQRGNQSHRQILHLNSANAHRNKLSASTNSVILTRGGSAVVPSEGFRLTAEARNKICALLDPHNESGNDWRRLAQHLGIQRNHGYFAASSSPTGCLLDLWEARHREAGAASNLLTLLRRIGRADVTSSIEKLVGAWV